MSRKPKKRIILIGSGGHCKSYIDVIEQTNKFEIIGIIDLKDKVGQTILDYPIIGTDEQTFSFKDKMVLPSKMEPKKLIEEKKD